jgi:hypothetical protein
MDALSTFAGCAFDRRRVPARRFLRALVHRGAHRARALRACSRASVHLLSILRRRGCVTAIRVDGEDGGASCGTSSIVLLPRNDLHLMGGDLSLPPMPGSDIIRPRPVGCSPSIMAAAANARMVCGFLGCNTPKAIRALHLAGAAQSQPRARRSCGMDRSTFQYARKSSPSDRAMLAKLSSCCSWRLCGGTRRACRTARPAVWRFTRALCCAERRAARRYRPALDRR